MTEQLMAFSAWGVVLTIAFLFGYMIMPTIRHTVKLWKSKSVHEGIVLEKHHIPQRFTLQNKILSINLFPLVVPNRVRIPEQWTIVISNTEHGKRTITLTKDEWDRISYGDTYIVETNTARFKKYD